MNIRICPNCNSPNVTMDHAIWWGDRIYYCKRCSFRSSLFPEITVRKIEDLKKLKLKQTGGIKENKKLTKNKIKRNE